MIFEYPGYVAIAMVTVKWQRSSIKKKKSIVFAIAVTMSVELLLIMILIFCLQ
jgi:hypothetical protein